MIICLVGIPTPIFPLLKTNLIIMQEKQKCLPKIRSTVYGEFRRKVNPAPVLASHIPVETLGSSFERVSKTFLSFLSVVVKHFDFSGRHGRKGEVLFFGGIDTTKNNMDSAM